MNMVDYKRLHEAMEISSPRTGSSFWNLLEKMFDEIVRLEQEALSRHELRSLGWKEL